MLAIIPHLLQLRRRLPTSMSATARNNGSAIYLQGLAGLTLVMLAALITSRFRDDTTAVVLTAVGAGNTAAALGVYLALKGALAFGIGADASADITRAAYQIRAIAETMISFPAALLVGAVAAWRHRAVRLWYVLASGVVAAIVLASGADLARGGWLTPDCELSFLGFFLLFSLWAAISDFVLIRPGVRPRKPSTQSDARGVGDPVASAPDSSVVDTRFVSSRTAWFRRHLGLQGLGWRICGQPCSGIGRHVTSARAQQFSVGTLWEQRVVDPSQLESRFGRTGEGCLSLLGRMSVGCVGFLNRVSVG